ncbi:MAG: aspartate dehydrogenase [Deltaproteobacteria bacterium]|nr:MAG: aspartate dehydrogenase [Deltaproteobacteria bacterium]
MLKSRSRGKNEKCIWKREGYMRTQNRPPLAVGMIGHGAIGRAVAGAIAEGRAGNVALKAILRRDLHKHRENKPSSAQVNWTFTDDAETFFRIPFDLVVEAAGQDALRQYGTRVLDSGRHLLITSIGALTDDAFFGRLVESAQKSIARIFLISGALPAVDWMAAAALTGACSTAITQAKPVASWRGTPAAEVVDLAGLNQPTCFFEGTAREAASRFPKSSNITAMLALATAGLDKTKVKLVADPTRSEMHTVIDFRSEVGNLRVEWSGVPLETNPKTSADVPFTVIKALRNLTDTVCYGL